MSAIVTSVLALIEQLLPLLGVGSSTTTLIGTIVSTLENLLPTMLTIIPEVYTSVKNIITALTADPSTTAAQLTALQALDAQVDAAFDAAAAAVNPDAPTAA